MAPAATSNTANPTAPDPEIQPAKRPNMDPTKYDAASQKRTVKTPARVPRGGFGPTSVIPRTAKAPTANKSTTISPAASMNDAHGGSHAETPLAHRSGTA